MVQWCWPPKWFSVGVHVDPRIGEHFGPYADVHFWIFIFSVGRNAAYTHADVFWRSFSRGGLDVHRH